MFLGSRARPASKAICESIVWKIRDPRHLITLQASTDCYRNNFAFYVLHFHSPKGFSVVFCGQIQLSSVSQEVGEVVMQFSVVWKRLQAGPARMKLQ
jgi:hypothetical protein